MQPPENKWLALRVPLPPPTINPELGTLSALPRSAECLRHFILSVEYWISPDGCLRWWLRLNVCVAAWLVVPAVLLMPLVSLVLHEFDGCLSMLVSIAWKLIVLSVLVTVAVLAIGRFKHRHKQFPSSSQGSPRRRK